MKNGPPQEIHALIPEPVNVTLYREKGQAGLSKCNLFKILDLGILSCITQIGNHMYPPKRKVGGDLMSHSRVGSVKTDKRDWEVLVIRTGIVQPQAK